MSDIITKLERIKQTKHEIKEAINTKGAICETDCFREYPERILAIPSGGSSGGGSSSGGSGDSLPDFILVEKIITENGIYEPDSTCDGFNKVIVNVHTSGGTSLPRAEEEEF